MKEKEPTHEKSIREQLKSFSAISKSFLGIKLEFSPE